eukprot:scaffold30692_cov138-Skeletonema_marinoi.AAC.1
MKTVKLLQQAAALTLMEPRSRSNSPVNALSVSVRALPTCRRTLLPVSALEDDCAAHDMIRAVEKRQEWHRLPTCAKKCDIIASNNSISCCTAVRRVAARWYYFLSKNQLLHGLPNMASREHHPKSRWQAIMLSTGSACCQRIQKPLIVVATYLLEEITIYKPTIRRAPALGIISSHENKYSVRKARQRHPFSLGLGPSDTLLSGYHSLIVRAPHAEITNGVGKVGMHGKKKYRAS